MPRINTHVPYNKCKGELRAKGLTYSDIAKCLGITSVAVSHKISGISDFYISEVKRIEKKFGISEHIFFEDKVANSTT